MKFLLRSCLAVGWLAACSPTAVGGLLPASDAGATDVTAADVTTTDVTATDTGAPRDAVMPVDAARVPCTTSRTCPGQVCSAVLGVCVDCTVDGDCPMTQRCRDYACVDRPPSCRTSRECSAMGLVCNLTRSECVECVGDVDCETGRYCRDDGTCQARVCVPGATRCADVGRQVTCDSRGSSEVTTTCPSGQTCRAGSCRAQVCAPGSASCDPATMNPRTCDADGGGYTASTCPAMHSCRDGRCTAWTCPPGSATCASSSARRTCNADGLTTTTTACASGQSCNGGVCVAQSCVPGSAVCADANTRSICNADGLGSTPSPCSSSQRCSGGTCRALVCTPGTSTCVDARTTSTCNADGLAATTAACPSGSTCVGGACSSWVCTPGAATCASAASRSVCNADGLGTTVAACPSPANASSPSCSGSGVCAFSCNAGFGDCNGVAADGCEASLSTNANCGSCGSTCSGSCSSGTCVAATGVTYGQAMQLGTSNTFSANYLLGHRVTVTAAGTIATFGLFNQSTTGRAQMALYTDASGRPGTLVAQTAAFTVTGGRQEIAATPLAPLAAGTYWLMAVYERDHAGYAMRPSTNSTAYVSFTFGRTPPSTFPTPTFYTGDTINYYIRMM